MNNYHTHTYRCKHAKGDIADYAAFALHNGIKVLGISDHLPFPDKRWDNTRMKTEEIPDYIDKIDQAKKQYPNLILLKGFECEYVPKFRNYYAEIKEKYQLDYLIGAEHWIPFQGKWHSLDQAKEQSILKAYFDNLIQAMSTGLFDFIAHPDMFAKALKKWSPETASACHNFFQAVEETQSILEVNSYGFRKPKVLRGTRFEAQYPWPPFWKQAANYKIKVIINSDAHAPTHLVDSVQHCADLVTRFNLSQIDLFKVLNNRKSYLDSQDG